MAALSLRSETWRSLSIFIFLLFFLGSTIENGGGIVAESHFEQRFI